VQQAIPEAERHTATRLLNHVYVVDRIFAAHLQGLPHGYTALNTPDTPALEALSAKVGETDRWLQAHLDELDEAQLVQELDFVFVDGKPGCMSRADMLLHLASHGSYHRGAVGRLVGNYTTAPQRDTLTVYLHSD
jgi:uncharacterized damage-inducible protein DinB